MQERPQVGMLIQSLSSSGGGVTEAVLALATTLHRRGNVDLQIFTLDQERDRRGDFGDIPVHTVPVVGPASFGYAPDLVKLMVEQRLDCVHVHALWTYLSVAAQRWARQTGGAYTISPHGMLDQWALHKGFWKKQGAKLLFENAHLNGATSIHALCGAESASIRAAGYGTQVRIIPNGVDAAPAVCAPAWWRTALDADQRVLLFLGRVTPKKGVATLLQAWQRAKRAGNAQPWRLVIAGPVDADYLGELRALIEECDIADSVLLAGPAYGGDRASAYGSADAFILPSLSEGLPMAALEAFSFGLPSLLTPECNLPEAHERGAAIAMASDEAGVVAGLGALFAMSEAERRQMGAKGRDLTRERYDWNVAAAQFEDLYAEISAPRRVLSVA